MLVCEYLLVDELLHFVDVDHSSAQGIHCCVFPVAYDSEEKMIGRYSVASGPHCLLSREIYYRAELV